VAFVRKEAVRRVERLVLGGVLLFIAALLTSASILHMHEAYMSVIENYRISLVMQTSLTAELTARISPRRVWLLLRCSTRC
jgi:hypothetical protein